MDFDDESVGIPERPASLAADLDRFEKQLAVVDESLMRLRKRLDPVLRPQPPTPTSTNEVSGGTRVGDDQSPVRARLQHLVQTAVRLGERANEIVARVDL